MFVSIEGIDGVGKSTSAALLAETSNFIKIPKRSNNYINIIDKAKAHGVNETTLFFLYLSGAVEQSILIHEHLKNGQDVVVARWTATQAASHHFHSKIKSQDPLEIDYKFLNIIKPDISFLLLLNDTVRSERMRNRGEIVGNDLKSLATEAQNLFLEVIRKVNPGIIEIDTSLIAPSQVVKIMQSHIGAYKSSHGM
ncbi:hypothetical protein [Dyadobacter frigoris]|uniref:Thymidylate kinase-like domain-containing protein n=1 Tax=Dyadobacter frigoris TaxID=2576211 RepID=A0A4U6DFH1_9BACT|nr:hypothetical protein [Dyadobacter frigoris]TKT93314.1 hypothetical protein FDK13_05535 [Dyadobacter frigoris]